MLMQKNANSAVHVKWRRGFGLVMLMRLPISVFVIQIQLLFEAQYILGSLQLCS